MIQIKGGGKIIILNDQIEEGGKIIIVNDQNKIKRKVSNL